MPTPANFPAGTPIWADLLSSDPDRAVNFYGRLFDWTPVPAGPGFGGYINFYKHNLLVAGLAPNTSQSPDMWTVYLATDDADDTAATVLANEGRVFIHDRIANLGAIVVFADPTGAVAGAWQPGVHTGYGIMGESGTAVWHELHARDYAAVLRFYESVFDWRPTVLSDTDDFRLATVGAPTQATAGIFDATYLGPEDPSRWMIYFGTADIDESAALIPLLGGVMLDEVTDSPFGRLAHVADPGGVVFTLIEPR